MSRSPSKLGVSVAAQHGGFAMLVGAKAARTPAGAALVLPSEALAEQVAGEWRGDRPPAGRLATRLACAAIDCDPAARRAMVEEIAGFARHDLVCYPAEQPAALSGRQAATWGPLRVWAAETFGVRLLADGGGIDQPAESIAALEQFLGALDPFQLIGLFAAARLFSSAVLALALMTGRLDGGAAHAAARLEEAFQQERWGEDAEAVKRAEGMLAEAIRLEAWFAALRTAI